MPATGNEPGVAFYTHISDQFGPFFTKVIAAAASEAPHVLDGLLYHQTGLQPAEHYTDTGGATDHVFGLGALLGFRFAPRLRDIKDRRLYLLPGMTVDLAIEPLVGGSIDVGHLAMHWDELLCLAVSIRPGTVTASATLHRLAAYPRQNGLAVAMCEAGRLERTLFTLEWIRSGELRRRAQAGLAKGKARNALARALFFNRLGELRDRRFENQAYRASGHNLLVAAIILWNTRYLAEGLDSLGHRAQPELKKHIVAPLGWEHISLTGDYVWNDRTQPAPRHLRPLRRRHSLLAARVPCSFQSGGHKTHFRAVPPMSRRRGVEGRGALPLLSPKQASAQLPPPCAFASAPCSRVPAKTLFPSNPTARAAPGSGRPAGGAASQREECVSAPKRDPGRDRINTLGRVVNSAKRRWP